MKGRVRLFFWNVLILGLLLIITNIFCWLILCYKDYELKVRNANLPAMINKNYWEIQEEWYKLETEYRPFIAWKRKQFTGKYVNVNVEGIRKTLNSKNGKTVRFFGGSTIWGARVEDGNTIPSLFGKCNNEEYKIINHGETGFNARQGLASLTNVFLEEDKTDLVIFYDGVNDVNHLCNSEISILGHEREKQFSEKLTTGKSVQDYFAANDNILGLSKQLCYKLFFQNTIIVIDRTIGKYYTKSANVLYSCHSDSDRAEQVANNLINCWKIAREISIANGSKFIAILQPNIYVDNAKSDYLRAERSGLQEKNYKSVYEIVQKKIKEEQSDWMFDFSTILNETTEPLYFDFCHLNGMGNAIIADEICKILD